MLKNDPSVREALSYYLLWGLRIIFFLLLVTIVWKSLEPAVWKSSFPYMDKVLHFSAYASLAFVALKSKLFKKTHLVVFVIIAIGLAVEVIQGLMGMGRSASVWDFIANTLGVLTSFWIYRRLK